jgi:hypothetical protein
MKILLLLLLTITTYSQEVILSAGSDEYSIGQIFYISPEGVQQIYEDEISLGIEKYENNDIMVYPNPVKDSLTIVSKEELDYYLFDVSGRLVQQGKVTKQMEIPKGYYILKIGDRTFKIVKL